MTHMQQRLSFWQFLLLLLFGGIILRLGYWQVFKHGELSQVATQQYSSLRTIDSERGQVLDRDGSILATNQELYTLFVEPKVVKAPVNEIAEKLLPVLLESIMNKPEATDEAWLKIKKAELTTHVITSVTKDKQWVPIQTRLSRDQKEAIEKLAIFGLGFDSHSYRYYPDASVSAHLLGFVGKDEEGTDRGYFGLEGYYDRELRGRQGKLQQQQTALGIPLAMGIVQKSAVQPGRTLKLTIDKVIQHQVEQILKKGMERYGAIAGEVVIMDPKTGGIIALAAFPNFDPSAFTEFDPKSYRNPAISDLYEPGSTMKVVTVAAGIESGVISPETECPRCSGPRLISGFSIRTWNEQYNPNVTMRDALAKSDNTAMVFIQEELGKPRFLEWLRKFGFEGRTEVDLQGEANYEFRPDKEWREIDVATSAFGQGIASTSLQLTRAVAAIANDGKLMRPYIVQSVIDGDEEHVTKPEVVRQVVSPETAETVIEMMVYTAEQGDAKWTTKREVKVAGKTGTAQISENGKYLEDKTIASFVGFAPADDPQFVMLVKLREPTSSTFGSETAAPLWYEILPLLLRGQ